MIIINFYTKISVDRREVGGPVGVEDEYVLNFEFVQLEIKKRWKHCKNKTNILIYNCRSGIKYFK